MEKKEYSVERNRAGVEKDFQSNSISNNKISVLVAAVNQTSNGEAKIVKIVKL